MRMCIRSARAHPLQRKHAHRRAQRRCRDRRLYPQSHSAKIQNAPKGAFHILSERVGFEPTVRENRTPDFESGPFDHSGTSPDWYCNHSAPAMLLHLIGFESPEGDSHPCVAHFVRPYCRRAADCTQLRSKITSDYRAVIR